MHEITVTLLEGEDVRKKIGEIRDELSYYLGIYRQAKDELSILDKHIMSLYKELWNLQRRIVIPLKVRSPSANKVRKEKEKEVITKALEDMTIDELTLAINTYEQALRERSSVPEETGFTKEEDENNNIGQGTTFIS